MRHLKGVISPKARRGNETTKAVHVIVWIASIILAGMVVSAALAGSATSPASPPPARPNAAEEPVKEQIPACSMSAMMAGGEQGIGGGMDMPLPVKRRCQMMMNAEMSKEDPACLLAFTQELDLTPEQVQKLGQIVKQSRQDAGATLTPVQQKILAEVAGQPTSMTAMHAKMHENVMQNRQCADPKTTEKTAGK